MAIGEGGVSAEAAFGAVLAIAGIYAGVGLAAAVALHARGLVRIDAGVRGAGWWFRLLVTPGIIALWPVLWLRWRRVGLGDGAAVGAQRSVPARRLRTAHRWLVEVLAVLVPLFAGAALFWRPGPVPTYEGRIATSDQAAPLPNVVGEYAAPFAPLPIALRLRASDEGALQVELEVTRNLDRPAVLLYWIPSDAGSNDEGAALLGSIAGPATRRYALPLSAQAGGGALRLFSAAHREWIGSFHLEAAKRR